MIKDILSAQNPLIKATGELKLKKYRSLRGEFLVEGMRAVQEAINSGWELKDIFFTDEVSGEEIVNMLKDKPVTCYHINQTLIERITDTKNPQGIVAVVKTKDSELKDLAGGTGLLLVLDEVRDPGNVGTIIRTADAAGACGIVLLRDCVDIYSPKVVRSTMGSVFHLPIITNVDKALFCEWCEKEQWPLWVSSLEGGTSIHETPWGPKVALVMGNEANGASAEMLKAAVKKVYIPMPGKAESLNVAIATGIFLFEGAYKQVLPLNNNLCYNKKN